MTVSTTTFLQDTLKFIRDGLLSNLTDPVSATRPSNSKFVITSYPIRPPFYPIITVRNKGVPVPVKLGMRSVLNKVTIPIEIRVWARNETEKDTLCQQVINFLRTNQFGGATTSSDGNLLFDWQIESSVPVDVQDGAGAGMTVTRCQVMTAVYNYILGT